MSIFKTLYRRHARLGAGESEVSKGFTFSQHGDLVVALRFLFRFNPFVSYFIRTLVILILNNRYAIVFSNACSIRTSFLNVRLQLSV